MDVYKRNKKFKNLVLMVFGSYLNCLEIKKNNLPKFSKNPFQDFGPLGVKTNIPIF
jgi:hypothetical protein